VITTRPDAVEYFKRRWGPIVRVTGDRFECRDSY
jgi:hypothetical protein